MKTNKQTAQTRRAFTLVELLVVIAIISLLAAILFPVFASARSRARQTACLSNLRQMGMAFLQYQHDHDDMSTPPYNTRGIQTNKSGWWFGTANADQTINWQDSPLAPYNKSYELMDCAESPKPKNPNNRILYDRFSLGFGYGNNQFIFNPSQRPKKITQFTNPGETIVLADAGWFNFGEIKPSYYIYQPSYVRTNASGSPVPPDDIQDWAEQSGGIRGHNSGFTNVLWSDYHVSSVKLTYRKADSLHARNRLGDIVHRSFPYSLRGEPADVNGFDGNYKLNYYWQVVKPPLPQ